MLDDYVTLGRSGLRVSRLALGSYNFGGGRDWELDPDTAHAIIDRYRALGGNFIDTANIYGAGQSEAIIGEHLARSPGAREGMVIASKFGSNPHPGDPNGGGAHRKSIMRSCEASLRRLRTDHIDLYWMHLWDQATPIDETMRALDDLVGQGKILHIGFSNVPAWKVAEAHFIAHFRGYAPVVALQLQYSLLERNIEAELVPLASDYGLAICPWSPLKSGALTGRFTRANLREAPGNRATLARRGLDDRGFVILDLVTAIAAARGVPPAQVALAWLRGRPRVTSILLGADSVAELEENAASTTLTLEPAEIAMLDTISQPRFHYPIDFVDRGQDSVTGGARINRDTAARSGTQLVAQVSLLVPD